MTLEFSSNAELQHHLATSIADDVVHDYESTVKSLMRGKKIFGIASMVCSFIVVFISLATGVLGMFNTNEVIAKIASVVTLSIAGVERIKVFCDSRQKENTTGLVRMIKKSGLETFGIYDRSGQSPIDETDHPGRPRQFVGTNPMRT